MIPPFKWIYTFMDTPDEWHTSLIGLGDGYCPWRKPYEPTVRMKRVIQKEIHYYTVGVAIGFALLIFSIALAVRLVLGAML